MQEPVYVIAQIDVKDYESYLTEYGLPLLDQLNAFGVEVLTAAPDFKVLEGDWEGNWIAIMKFPSAEAFREFYESEKYAPLKRLRIDKLSNTGSVVMVPGIKLQ
jgi:uncharacterized protein (DUF1330 family)